MTVSQLLKLIPQKALIKLAAETKVDAQVKKLSGEVMFKLILFSMINSEKLSLRVMETFLQSAQFKSFSGFDIIDSRYNSIRDRICTIDSSYFEELFRLVFTTYNKELKEQSALSKTDSTMVTLSAKLFTGGITNYKDDNRFIKYSVNLKGSLPSSIKIFKDQSYASEELAMAEVINADHLIEGNIVVFDRGLQSRKSFDEFTDNRKLFITRANLNVRCNVVKSKKISSKPKNSTVTIKSDETGYLINKKEKESRNTYRLIKGVIDKTGEEICFVTNIMAEKCYVIAGWYKQRWEIEVFFKFLKQHLNVKHLVSRTENGMKVMIYMTMIIAILILAYKKINGIKGYKIAKLKFEIELDNEIIKQIVLLCGGDPRKAVHLFNSG